MKTIKLMVAILLLFQISLSAQGIRIWNGTTVTLGNTKLSLQGDWSNSGTFNPGASEVIFMAPTGDQSITNTAGETFNDFTVNKAADDVILQDNIKVAGSLVLESGDVDLNGNVITLGASASMDESNGAIVKGASGYITTTRNLVAPNNVNVAGLGIVLTTAANMGSTVIRRGHTEQSCSSLLRYYDIVPTNNTGLNAGIVFNYFVSELNGLTEADLQLLRSTDGGVHWSTQDETLNTVIHTASATGINAFSRWTLATDYNPPGLATIEAAPLEYMEDNPATAITAALTITGNDFMNINSGTVQITGNYQNSEDELRFANFSNITGTWNAGTGTMTLNGTDTRANYLTALRSVKYVNTNNLDPVTSIENGEEVKTKRLVNATPRTVSFTVSDGENNSNTLTRDINITPTNDGPIVTTNTGAILNEGGSVVITKSLLNSTDPEGDTYIAYYLMEVPINGELKNGGTPLNAGGTFTQANINAGNIIYFHDGSETTNDSFKFEIADNHNATGSVATFQITINPVENPPLQPTNVVFSYDDSGNIVLTWYDNSGNELGFYIWRQRNTTAKLSIITEYELIATLPAGTESYVDENIEEGVDYTYQVTSFNEFGESEVAQGENGGEVTTTAPLYTPTNLHATDNGNCTLTIEWVDNSSLETGFIIERKNGDVWEEIYSAAEDATSFTDTNVEAGTTYYYRVKAFNAETESVYSNECEGACTITSIEDLASGTPTEFTLQQNYPNPFNPSTIICYGLPEDAQVKIIVYNMLGQEVATLVDQFQSSGYHDVTFKADGLNSGIYLYKIEAGSNTEIKKMIFLK